MGQDKYGIIYEDAERTLEATREELVVRKSGKTTNLAWRYMAGISDRVTYPETLANIKRAGGKPEDYFAVDSAVSEKQIAFPISTRVAVEAALKQYWHSRTPEETLRDVSFICKNKAVRYLRQEVNESTEAKEYLKRLESRFGYQRYEFLGDFDPSYDVADVLAKEGFSLEKEEPLSTEKYVGSFQGGEVNERTFMHPDGRRWFVYELPMRADVDSFATDNVITNRPLTVEEYMELHFLLTGTKEMLAEQRYEKQETLPALEKRIEEEKKSEGIDPDLYWSFLLGPGHGEHALVLIKITENNVDQIRKELLSAWDIDLGGGPEPDETAAEFEQRKRYVLAREAEWFDEHKEGLVLIAERIREEMDRQMSSSDAAMPC